MRQIALSGSGIWIYDRMANAKFKNEGNQMFTITLDPIIAHLGPFVIRWYSLILLTAIFVGVWITSREADRRGFNKEEIFDVSIWIIVGGLIGARPQIR